MAINTKGTRIKMSVEKWIDVPDNPSQRDTAKHAERAAKTHLKYSAVTHDKVVAATIDGEIVCKVDGHTRAYLWDRGLLERPKYGVVYVDLYEVQDMCGAAELYRQFDSPHAVETTTDKLFSGAKMAGVELHSGLLKPCKFMVALQIASLRSTTASRKKKHDGIEHQLISKWANELMVLDSWDMKAGAIPGPMIALALMLLRTGESQCAVREFIDGIAHKRISITPEVPADGITHMVQMLEKRRLKKLMTGWCNLIDILGEGLGCWRRYKHGVLAARAVAIPVDFGDWLAFVNPSN